MKKLFNHTKRPDRNWEEDVQDGYDWDEEEYTGEEDGEEYYADEEEYPEETDGEEYYAEEEEYTGEEDGEEYYADEEEYTGEEDGEEYYADEEEYTGEEDGEEYYADDVEYIEESDDEEYYADEDYEEEPAPTGRRKTGGKKQGGIAVIWAKFLNLSTMDRIMAATGVAVLILAIVTGSVYALSLIHI